MAVLEKKQLKNKKVKCDFQCGTCEIRQWCNLPIKKRTIADDQRNCALNLRFPKDWKKGDHVLVECPMVPKKRIKFTFMSNNQLLISNKYNLRKKMYIKGYLLCRECKKCL